MTKPKNINDRTAYLACPMDAAARAASEAQKMAGNVLEVAREPRRRRM